MKVIQVTIWLAFQAILAHAIVPQLLGKRTSCSTPDGSGTCEATSSCDGFYVANYCPGAASNQCCIEKSCAPPAGEGICRNTAAGCSGGSFVSGYCPGSSSVQCCVGQSCTTPDGSGHCKSTSSCSTFSVAGYCPGSSGYQCCVSKTCSTPQGSGTCKDTSNPCSGGTFVSGYCPGPSSVQCCVVGAKSTTSVKPSTTTTSKPSPTGTACANVKAIDLSTTQSSTFWACAKKTYDKAVIRAYSQACGQGGAVDATFSASYKAAKAAGFTNFDAYLFPCTGTPPPGCGDSACKSPSDQITAFEAAIKASGMTPVHVWLDIEQVTGVTDCDGCNSWNLGTADNLALAKQFVAIMRKSTYKYGIYANRGTWAQTFGASTTDVASDLPLWAVQVSTDPSISTVTPFGGWTKAYAKQYSESNDVCGGTKNADLDTFCN